MNSIKWSRAVSGLALTFILGACSEVSFSPAPPKEGPSTLEDSTPDSGGLGSISGEILEAFNQRSVVRKVDLLVIVDNSLSMAEEQSRLGARIQSFLNHLGRVDWQLAVTTTDVSTGPYGLKGSLLTMAGTSSMILNKNVPNYEQVFLDTVVRSETLNCVGSCPSADEQALRAAIMAMDKRNTDNRGFFRDDADLGLLILSDEDEMSTGPALATKPEAVLDHFRSIWGDSKDLYTYGIITLPGDVNCLGAQGRDASYGTHVSDLSDLTGGLTGSICSEEYGETLGQIGKNLIKLLDSLRLKAAPDEDSIMMLFDPPQPDVRWSVYENKIIFDVPPKSGTKIRVAYDRKRRD